MSWRLIVGARIHGVGMGDVDGVGVMRRAMVAGERSGTHTCIHTRRNTDLVCHVDVKHADDNIKGGAAGRERH
jgi:hypothetical protein